jgi:hypothetical protein
VTAAEVLKAARAAGINFKIDGNNLLLQAPSAPPAALIDLLLR